ncbi:amidohydrolase family protein [Lysobacter sp. S4-A87]|uniref:metal-dependent hydrolase family protein n=1 Tax=Lysobacter sp. S4-A87 TaxID=2925843 RepID=UPI001F536D66|nr:amidohydrolase family protein [Lysobacter sp. S4-A87]UNK47988.1 amidohydrolase family protein [Lysobacter sp. S4-A87]
MKLHVAAALTGLSLALSAALIAHAQAPAGTAAPAAQPVVLRAAHLFDGRSGRMTSPGLVVVQGDRIVGIGPSAPLPANARVIDLGEATLLPGFIDAHTHIASDHDDNWAQGFYENMLRFPVEQSFHAARNAKLTLEAGFTTVREVGAPDFVDVALRNAINGGLAEGPRMLVAGHAIGSTGGHCDASPFPPERVKPAGTLEGVCNGAEQCRLAVREQMKFGADLIKICASGGVLSEADPVDVPQLTPDELAAIIGEAHTWGRKVAAHSHGDLAARQAVEAGVDSIEHGSFLTASTLQLMKQKGTYLVPTRMTQVWVVDKASSYPPKIGAKARAAGEAHTKMFKEALRIGVPIALGTDAAVYPHGMNAQEFGDMVDLGMSPATALLTSSQGSAKLLGVDGETGTLEVGKFADVVAVSGNVLENIRATERPVLVMKQGKVFRGGE